MRVKSITLINVKSYENTTIELSKSINLLVGANNAGKSTIIKSLLNLQYRAFEKKDIRATKQYSKIYTQLIEIEEKDESFYNKDFPKEFEFSTTCTVCWGLTHKSDNEENLYHDDKNQIKKLPNDSIMILNSENEVLDLKKFARFSDLENQNNFIYPFLAKRKTEYYDSNISENDIYKVTENLRNIAAKIQKLSNPSHPQNEEFNSLCLDILGFKIGIIHTGQNNNYNLEPGIYTNPNSLVSIRSMGDGVANIVGFIVLLLTEDKKLFLIEELENDIHPKALKKLLNLIIAKSNKNQFVISTHSHIVLKYLGVIKLSKIFYIDWTPFIKVDHIIENVPTSFISEVENTPQKRIEVLEKLGYDFYDFELFEAYLLLEESSAERIIRDVLIPYFVPNLYNKIKTIAAKGVEDLKIRVIDFNRLFVFIHTNPIYSKKAWVIADGDTVGKSCINELMNQFKDWPKDHFINFQHEQFEKYYPDLFQEKVSEILKTKDKDKKREAKAKLLNEVVLWSFKNRELALKEFSTSAKEVIDILAQIDKKVNANLKV